MIAMNDSVAVFLLIWVIWATWAILAGGGVTTHRRGLFFVFFGGLVGSLFLLNVAGISSTLGATTRAGVGFATWLIIGTLGVTTGGVGVALGAAGMVGIGALLGTMSGAAGGFGIQIVAYPLVSPVFWVPLMVLGGYFLLGKRKIK